MRKFYRLGISMLLLLAAALPAAFAYNFQSGGIYYDITGTSPNTVAVTYATGSYNSYSGTVDIPSTVTYNGTTYTVTAIGNNAFRSCSNLTGVTIPNTVTSIGEYAFYYCQNLPSVTIPNGVETIGANAFYYCRNTTSVSIGNTVTTIGNAAFQNCSGLTAVSIPNSVTTIGSNAFQGCSALTTLTIGESVTNIGNSAFLSCSSLASITIPHSVTTIGEYAFRYCNSLTSVSFNADSCEIMGTSTHNVFSNCIHINHLYIGNNVKNIPNYAFTGCDSLTSLYIPDAVSYIAPYAFYNCSNISSISVSSANSSYDSRNNCNAIIQTQTNTLVYGCNTSIIPNTVTAIGELAFSGRTGLTGTLVFPSSVSYIGPSAFNSCSGITSLIIGESIDSIGVSAFANCTGLTSLTFNADSCTVMGYNISNSNYASVFTGCNNLSSLSIGDNVLRIPDFAFYGLDHLSGMLFLPDSLMYIGNCAFYNCSSLTGSLVIPRKVSIIGANAFYNCSGITTLVYNADSCTFGGVFYSPVFLGCSNLTTLIIGESVKMIPDLAFSECSNLSGELFIPNSVQSIGFCAFRDCSGLTGTLSLPLSLKRIGDCAFYNCSGLTGELVIHDSISYVGYWSFYNCTGLTSLTIGKSVDTINHSAFLACTGLSSVIYNADSCTYMGYRSSCGTSQNVTSCPVFQDCANLTTLTIGENVKMIPSYAFAGCSALVSVTIPRFVKQIGGGAFSGCENLNTVTFNADSCGGFEFFSNLTNLTSITIGEHVKHIPDGIFSGCTGLTGMLTIPISVQHIGHSAFSGCTGLSGTLIIPDSVTYIGSNSFDGCLGFDTLVIGKAVSSIEGGSYYFPSAFRNCTGLTTLYYNADSCAHMGSNIFSTCNNITSVVIGDNVKTVPNGLCNNCSSILFLTVGKNVRTIGANAFSGCSNMMSVSFNADSCLNVNNAFTNSTSLSTVNIGENVKLIPDNAFKNCINITGTPQIPDSVIYIGASAFEGCSGLTGMLSIPDFTEIIGNNAFSFCSGLSGELIIPDAVRIIGSGAFAYCGLTSLSIGKGVDSINSTAFYYCSHLTKVVYNADSCHYMNTYSSVFYGCDSLSTLSIGDNVKLIPDYAFYHCSSLTGNIIIPNSVTYIGNSAFDGCSGLTGNIIIPNSVTSIGNSAFYGCSGFDTLVVGEGVQSISSSAFGSCSGLHHIDFNADSCATMERIYQFSRWRYVFDDCTNLISLTIGNNVKLIPSYAFGSYSGLINLTKLIIGKSVDSIYSGAFSGCTGLSSITSYNVTPPVLELTSTHPFNNVSRNTPVYVPCGTADAYRAAWRYYQNASSSYFNYYADDLQPYLFTVLSDDTLKGSVQITAQPSCWDPAVIEATPNFFYVFDHWSDGNTDNPRTITLSQDTTLVAHFREYDLHINCDTNYGHIVFLQVPTAENPQAVVQVVLNPCYLFGYWTDYKHSGLSVWPLNEEYDNPRTITLSQDTTMEVVFRYAHPIDISSDRTSLCEGDSTVLKGVTYPEAWSGNTAIPSNSVTEGFLWVRYIQTGTGTYHRDTLGLADSIVVSTAGTYRVMGIDSTGCTAYSTISIEVHPNPTIMISGETEICAGNSTTLTAGLYEFSEDFTNGVPAEWTTNGDALEIYTLNGNSGNAILFPAYDLPENTQAELILPDINLKQFDQPSIGFKIAYYGRLSSCHDVWNSTYPYWQNICDTIRNEDLKIMLSTDGGITWTEVYRASNDYSYYDYQWYVSENAYYPQNMSNSHSGWASLSIFSEYENVKIKFVFTGGQGNNMWLDDIQLYSGIYDYNLSYLWSNGGENSSQTFDDSGTYYVTVSNRIGRYWDAMQENWIQTKCSTTDSVTITVWEPSDTTEVTVNTPESYYVMNGETFCTSGDYTLNLQNVHGCDSVVILHLTVTPHFTVVNDTVFGRRLVRDNGSIVQDIEGRRYSYQYKMTPDKYAQWADSILTMWTEWYEIDSTSIDLSYDTATNMASWSYARVYDYRKELGSVVSQKTIYLDASYIDSVGYEVSDTLSFLSSFGCDSSVIWKTQVYFKDIVELNDLEECNYVWQGDSIYYYSSSQTITMGFASGDTLKESGKYRQNLTNVSSCDSTVYWFFTIHPTAYEEITEISCDNYTLNGVVYTESGDYVQNIDTTLAITRNIIYHNAWSWGYWNSQGSFIQYRPDGWSYLQTHYDSETGIYTYSYTDQFGVEHPYVMGETVLYTDTVPGCCFVVTLHLTINPSVTELVEATACDSYTWNDSTYTTSGEYVQTFTAANGCDSTVTLQLTINESKHTDTTAESCGSYTWNETTYTSSGEYIQNFTAANGCDSTVTLQLTILPLPTPNITGVTTVCEGQTATLNATGGVSYLWEDGTTTNTYPATTSGLYTVTVTNAEGCSATASTTVTVNPLPEVVITGSTAICPGGSTVLTATGADSYMWSNGSSNSSIPVNMFGQYSVIGTSAAGCFSTASVTVLVSQPPVITISGNTDICAGESTTLTANDGVNYMWSNGSTADTLVATTGGTWQVIGYNADGCSNMASVTVNLWQPATTNLYITSFDSCYMWFGTPRCESGDYTHTLQTIHGCDSVIILHLTLEDAITTEFSATSCDSYTWNGITYSQSGNYTQNFTAVNGNDSIVTLHLTINYSVSEVVEVTACDSYEWNGQTYTSSGNYTQTFIAANECDSVVTLNLTVNPSVSEVVEATACDSYLWNDSNYTVSGDYIQIFTAANGCDSVVTLHLTINHPVAEFVETTVCDSYEWNGQSYVTSGDYTQTFTAANGCDSVVTLHLIVNDTKHVEFADSTCTTYTWNGQSYAQSGDYTQNFTAANGCDSVVTLHLTIVPTITPVIAVNGSLTACGNGSATLTVPGNYSNFVWSTGAVSSALTVNEAGYYWVTATDVYGCEGVSEMVQLGGSVQIDETPAICMVGVDNDHNLVVWEPLTDPDVSEYRIYREDGQANIFEPLAVIPASNSNAYVDATADPSVRAYRYKITAADTCGGETPMSAFHKTVHLTINQGLGNSYNLIWTPYEGFEFSSYKLYRGTANNNLQLIQTMPSTLTSYTDNNPAGDALFYQIEVVMTESCVQQTRDITYTGARSNIVYNGVAVTTEVTIEACDSYDWNGQILTSSGDYTQNFVSELGYDSVVTLHLTINPSVTEVIEVTTLDSCYTWNGQDYCTSGTYTQTLQTVHGCDSVVTMHLTITVGVNDYDGFDFKVYPNPTTGVVNVQITNHNSPITEFHVFDAYGKLIRVVDVQTTQIDLSGFASGVYFIKAVSDGNVVAVRKVVKQ